jgi:Flp pilus assembly protein TadG
MLARFLRFLRDQGGTAALELAGAGTFLAFGVMNVADVARYAYQTSDVSHAAQVGAEAALVTCNIDHVPATLNCQGLQSAVTTAIHSTGLGNQIALDGPLSEGYYCRTTTGALTQAGSASSKPVNCSGVANAATGASPTLYLRVRVTYAFEPLFPGTTLAGAFSSNIVRSAWMRMA